MPWADELRQNAPRYHLNNPNLVGDSGPVPSAVFIPVQTPNAQPYAPNASPYAQPYAPSSQPFVPTAVPAQAQNQWMNHDIPVAAPVNFPAGGSVAYAPQNAEPMYAVSSNPDEQFGQPRRQLVFPCCAIC
jgi:hypothetical protein